MPLWFSNCSPWPGCWWVLAGASSGTTRHSGALPSLCDHKMDCGIKMIGKHQTCKQAFILFISESQMPSCWDGLCSHTLHSSPLSSVSLPGSRNMQERAGNWHASECGGGLDVTGGDHTKEGEPILGAVSGSLRWILASIFNLMLNIGVSFNFYHACFPSYFSFSSVLKSCFPFLS